MKKKYYGEKIIISYECTTMLAYSTNRAIRNTESRQMTKMAEKVRKYLDKGMDIRKAVCLTSIKFGVDETLVLKAIKINKWLVIG